MGAVGWLVFEHREAFLTPLGGWRRSRQIHLNSEPLTWPRATISVTLGAKFLNRLVRPIARTHLAGYTCGSGRLAGV